MFRKPFARFCLRELNVSPVYRIEEGFGNVHKNLESFTSIYEILRKNGNFIMFSEGICVQEKRLQKLRKGTARLAFGAEEKFDLDVYIVPVGINYTYPASFRKEVMINFHNPFSIKELSSMYKEHPAKALLTFNEKCDIGLREQVIIIENPKNDWLAEQLLKMGRNDLVLPFFRWKFDSDDRRLMEKGISEKINYLDRKDVEKLDSLTQKVKTYTDHLAKNKLYDENIARKLDWGILRYFALLAGFPVFAAGYLSNLIPFLIPQFICNKFIKDPRFYSSLYISSGTLLYLIYFPVVLILAGIFAGWTGFLLGFLVPLTGYLALFYQEVFRERMRSFRFNIKKTVNPSLIKDLTIQRQNILKELEEIEIIS